jgi:hypothetical protein
MAIITILTTPTNRCASGSVFKTLDITRPVLSQCPSTPPSTGTCVRR